MKLVQHGYLIFKASANAALCQSNGIICPTNKLKIECHLVTKCKYFTRIKLPNFPCKEIAKLRNYLLLLFLALENCKEIAKLRKYLLQLFLALENCKEIAKLRKYLLQLFLALEKC